MPEYATSEHHDLASLASAFVRSPRYRDFTLRQLALISVLADEPGPHTVRGLAARLQFSKPVVSRAINTLIGIAERTPDPRDRRNVFITLTPEGTRIRLDILTLEAANG